MAFTLGPWTKIHTHPFTVGVSQAGSGGYHYELADLAATSTPVQCPTGVSYGRAVICQKTFTSGSGTVGPVYELQVASDNFTNTIRSIGFKQALRTVDNQTLLLEGPVPDLQSNSWVRIKATLSGTDTVVFDALIDLLPGV